MVSTVLFDLDGTLHYMDEESFVKKYFSLLCRKIQPLGYKKDEFMPALLKSIEAMYKNDGRSTNEEVCWQVLENMLGSRIINDKGIFDEFYKEDFNGASDTCKPNPNARRTIKSLKERRIRLVVATNPLFPKYATYNRMRWAHLDLEDFEWVTTYENSSFCKPNPKYYSEILLHLGVNADECLMVGNDVEEDMAATEIGIKGFLLTDQYINRKNLDSKGYPQGGYPELWSFLDREIDGGFKI